MIAAAVALSRSTEAADGIGRHSARGRVAAFAPWFGLGAALLVSTGLTLGISGRVLDRELVHGYAALSSLAAAVLMAVAHAVPRIHRLAAVAVSAAAPSIVLVPRGLALAAALGQKADYVQVGGEAAGRVGGIALGIALSVVVAAVLMQLVTRHSPDGRRLMVLPIVALAVAESPVALNMLFILGYLPITPTLVGLAAPLMNAEDALHYVIVASLVAVGAWRIWRPVPPETYEPANAAEARLRRARRLQVRHVAIWSIGAAILIVSLGVTQAAVAARARAASALTPPKLLEPSGSEVLVAEAEVSDKNLHRFAVDVDGVKVRFIVVYKGSGLFGTGLDACEICGPTGYFQRESNVICKACDVVIPSPTIGFGGGCNPIPIRYEKRDGSLVFGMAQLRDGVGEFN